MTRVELPQGTLPIFNRRVTWWTTRPTAARPTHRASRSASHSEHPHWIVRTLRERGAPIPRFVWYAGEEDALLGELSIDWEDSDVHRRRMRLARFGYAGTTLLPPLRDVRVVRMMGNDLTLTGFEQIEDREYAQSWFCRLAREGWVQRGKPEDSPFAHIRA